MSMLVEDEIPLLRRRRYVGALLAAPSVGGASPAPTLALVMAIFLIYAPSVLAGQGHDDIKIAFKTPPDGHPLIEFEKLPADIREPLRKVADGYTLYMVAEKHASPGDPYLYEYLFDRLSLSALLLRELKLANYNIYEEDSNNYALIDPKGVFGRFKLVYKEPGKRIYFGSGFYDSRLMPRVDGRVVMIFKYQPVPSDDVPLMENEVHSYIELENFLFSSVARALQPILPSVVKEKMNKLFLASKFLSERIATDPADVYRVMEASSRVDRENLIEFKDAFVDNQRH